MGPPNVLSGVREGSLVGSYTSFTCGEPPDRLENQEKKKKIDTKL